MTDPITFTVGNKTYEVKLQKSREWRDRNKKARAHVWGPGDDRSPAREFQALADHIGAPNVYTANGEWLVLDKAFAKMNREIVAAKRAVLEPALTALHQQQVIFVTFDTLQISFSRKAGCSCGCSPGFIIGGLPLGTDIYISEKKN